MTSYKSVFDGIWCISNSFSKVFPTSPLSPFLWATKKSIFIKDLTLIFIHNTCGCDCLYLIFPIIVCLSIACYCYRYKNMLTSKFMKNGQHNNLKAIVSVFIWFKIKINILSNINVVSLLVILIRSIVLPTDSKCSKLRLKTTETQWRHYVVSDVNFE